MKRYYVTTGANRVTVDAKSVREAATDAIERIVSDDVKRSMGQITMVSLHGFESDANDDVFVSTSAIMQEIGFRPNKDGELQRCRTCRGVGRLDCCDKIDCLDCGGLGTKFCTDCTG
jgi:hypothetical protein